MSTRASSSPASLATGTVVKSPDATEEIRWGSFVSQQAELEDAVEEAVQAIRERIGKDAQPELALVFVSSVHGEEFNRVVPLLRERLPSLRYIFGCSVSSKPRRAHLGLQPVDLWRSMERSLHCCLSLSSPGTPAWHL